MPSKEALRKLVNQCVIDKGWDEDRCRKYIAGGIWNADDITDITVKDKNGKAMPKTLRHVPVLKAGNWTDAYGRPVKLTIQDLNEIETNSTVLLKTHLLEPPLKLGHNDPQNFYKVDGMPAIGHVAKVYRIGDELFVDLIDVPYKVVEAIERRNYTNISGEVKNNFQHPITKEKMGKLLYAVALLGAELPAIKGLGDIELLYNSENVYQDSTLYMFKDSDLQEANEMAKVWTLKDVEDNLPGFSVKIKEYMAGKKVDTLDQQQLAELMTEIKMSKLSEPSNDDAIVCPIGYSWNAETMVCDKTGIMTGDTEDKQIVCPQGYQLSAETKACMKLAEVKPPVSEATPPAKTEDTKLPVNEYVPINKQPDSWDENDFKAIDTKVKSVDPKILDGIKADMADETKRPPKGWWDQCIAGVSGKTDSPEMLCGWVYAHGISPEAKTTAESTRASELKEQADKLAADAKIKADAEAKAENITKLAELETEVQRLSKEKRVKLIDELKANNRGILQPHLDAKIDQLLQFAEQADKEVGVLKFGEIDVIPSNLVVEFLQELAKVKPVILGEIAGTMGGTTMSDNDVNKFAEQDKSIEEDTTFEFSELAKQSNGIVDETELKTTIRAKQIQLRENISFADAYVKADAELKQK